MKKIDIWDQTPESAKDGLKSGGTKQKDIQQTTWPIILFALTGADSSEILKKKFEAFKEETYKQYKEKERSSDNHCDYWELGRFVQSPNGKLVAYKVARIYETYRPGRDQSYHGIEMKNLETWEKSSPVTLWKILDSSDGYFNKSGCIDEIISVTDDGKVTYKVRSGDIITK